MTSREQAIEVGAEELWAPENGRPQFLANRMTAAAVLDAAHKAGAIRYSDELEKVAERARPDAESHWWYGDEAGPLEHWNFVDREPLYRLKEQK